MSPDALKVPTAMSQDEGRWIAGYSLGFPFYSAALGKVSLSPVTVVLFITVVDKLIS
ncbi:hypothetical protein J6590_049283 [Homalodisca vitripennis]|nr:hypothetical protein J6590_049283 [Homalodisca vitripennis]